MKRNLHFLILGIIAVVFASCNKFSGSQEVPAYICFKPWQFTADYDRYGAATEAITDVWLYVDGNQMGCYELREKDSTDKSVTIPVLYNGTHKLQLYPGIKLNGIASTRVQYPFYVPYTVESHEFTPGKADTVRPATTYYDIDDGHLHFKLMEDFESFQLKFTKISTSDTTITRVSREQTSSLYDPNAWTGDPVHSKHSGHVWLGIDDGDTVSNFCIATPALYDLPNQGNSILLEIDYKCTQEFEVGLYALTSSGLETNELVYLKATDKWKKNYINLGPTITDAVSASYFKLFIAGEVNPGDTANFYFDNIKIIYRD